MKRNRKPSFWVFIALGLCLVSLVGASLIQSSGGRVTIKDLRWETPSGHLMSALLFVPDTATKDAPAPAIVTSHGWYNNREMQDLNYVEYARRGYVVISIDMYGHGNSDVVSASEWSVRGTGMYDAVELVAKLPYVDAARIGITGHSNGARAANWTIDEDNKQAQPLVSAVLLVANDATYKNPETGAYWNKYGSRDVGIIAAQFDEFFFRIRDAEGKVVSAPREYIQQPTAQSFLYFGVDPETITGEARVAGEMYKETIDGQEAVRVIHTPYQTHPWNHFSKTCVVEALDFFETALGAPNPIASVNQIWQWKVLFNAVGLVGFVMFVIAFACMMVKRPFFAALAAKAPVKPASMPKGAGAAWFWGGMAASSLFGALIYLPLFAWCSSNRDPFFMAAPPYYIGVWSMLCGLFSLTVMVLWYGLYGKKNGMRPAEHGVRIGWENLGKTILLALLTVTCAYGIVFAGDYFFKADFRLWVLTIKAFTPDKIGVTLRYLPFFLVFYVINSVAINSFNHVQIGKKEWVNTALLAVMNGIGPLVICILQYSHFFMTGWPMFKTSAITTIWLIPIFVILPVAAVISRKIYRATNNPYLAGIINAILVTLISVTNTLIQLP